MFLVCCGVSLMHIKFQLNVLKYISSYLRSLSHVYIPFKHQLLSHYFIFNTFYDHFCKLEAMMDLHVLFDSISKFLDLNPPHQKSNRPKIKYKSGYSNFKKCIFFFFKISKTKNQTTTKQI